MEMIRAGPVGDTGSKTDTDWDEKGKTMISHIFVSFNSSRIISIQFGYIENGALVMSSKYGGDFKGQSFRVVKLKHNEYVTGLIGCREINSLLSRCEGINSLTFYTNWENTDPFVSLESPSM
ncbi:Jacalin-like lectin domain superfamily [Arabidopsis thaliana x Arabidopsis arenosa]|uniref:Jacalin-like lectin domain superfamily n=1 Tax=Arabidopsis thaliana x Arabidopsis arenosa TaxID=1240361 RepID=A0A8T2AA09_9BRAS|nr:Jacalin-like lectin domain superfamily [Arabidopsis thaliana x Arabidopsis arenosa]